MVSQHAAPPLARAPPHHHIQQGGVRNRNATVHRKHRGRKKVRAAVRSAAARENDPPGILPCAPPRACATPLSALRVPKPAALGLALCLVRAILPAYRSSSSSGSGTACAAWSSCS